jgi:hypothetical protein
VSALALDSPAARGRTAARVGRAPALCDHLGGELTLDKLLSGAWEGLAAHNSVACPLCGGEMTPDYGVHALPIGGRCGNCDTKLS